MADDLRYPVGTSSPVPETPQVLAAALDEIERLPAHVRAAVSGLSDAQLDTPYRPGGWTVRQVVHHLADSHMNGLTRTKLALTEDNPTIKPYDENGWSTLADMAMPIDVSLAVLDGLHARWTTVLRALTPEQRQRTFHHPERRATLTVSFQIQDYAWHGRHHVAHITALRRRQGW